MRSIDHEAIAITKKVLNLLLPPGIKATERRELARRANLVDDTLRHLRTRQSFSFETYVRLALARGIAPATLTDLKQTETEHLSEGEVRWLEYGCELNDAERTEFVEMIKFIRARWGKLKG